MIVPAHWAEGRIHRQIGERQVTVRRFGWSDESLAAAQAHADARTLEAFDRIAAGESLPRRERKLAYNGAQGMPIREEIVARRGDTVITRNGYGARCLNTPDVLFVDIDFESPVRGSLLLTVIVAALLASGLVGVVVKSWVAALLAGVVVLAIGAWRLRVERLRPAVLKPEDPIQQASARIERFLFQHPDWHLRLYRTPGGLRVLAMHRLFSPSDTAVVDCFQALGADPVYARMCRNQNCFRARVSAKPWRIGIHEPMRPRPGVWPVAPERLAERDAWVAKYERAAAGHAACTFLEALGAPEVHPEAEAVRLWHDELCGAESGLPAA